MTNMKAIKRALFSSVLALILCFAMLVGTTFAWFTDSVTSANNKIVAGNLDVQLFMHTSASTFVEITDTTAPIFGAEDSLMAQNDAANTLWEPGKTQVVYLSIKNNGTLDMKYKVALNVQNPEGGKDLYKVLQYAIANDAKYGDVTAWDANAGVEVVTGVNPTQAVDVALKAGEEHFFALSIHMLETAGNEYMNGSVIFDIQVLAGQLASESDSFNNQYDKDAEFPGTGFVTVDGQQTAYEIQVRGKDDYKDASFTIPAEAVAGSTGSQLSATVNPSDYEGNFTIAAGLEKTVYEVEVTGLKEGNTIPVKTQLKAPAGLDPATVAVYHVDTMIPSTYNPVTGYVTFETADFSPFTIVYDAESEYVAPAIPEGATHPTAKVTYMSQYVNTTLPWGKFGQWSPTEGLESTLDAAFQFTCPDYKNATDEAKALIEAYRGWYCDFFISLDAPLGANEIFLGGNYGSFGWVGFHNKDLTLSANTEIALLSSVTTNPWTYADVENYVGEFLCGVGDVNGALEGSTFTVKLRLIDPSKVNTENSEWWANLPAGSYVDVNVVTYTFGGNSVIDGTTVVTTGEGLQEAVNGGSTNISLGNDIDLSQGIVIPGN